MCHYYSIQIRHFRTGVWTHNTSSYTTASAEELQKQYETSYNQPVRVVKVTQEELERIEAEQFDPIVKVTLGF